MYVSEDLDMVITKKVLYHYRDTRLNWHYSKDEMSMMGVHELNIASAKQLQMPS
jgi:hypothetical protein